MDYKKIIRSRTTRIKILNMLSFLPDKTMVKLQYRIKTGRRLNLKDPKRYSEKLQWYKLYYKDPKMIPCVDKYDVRGYIKSCGLESILNECYGVFDTVEEIDFDKLPERFVAKDTLGAGGNEIAIIKDKSNTNLDALKKRMETWLSFPVHKRNIARSWPFNMGKGRRIILEKYLDSDASRGGLIDYKFFCFNGKVEYIYVIADRDIGNGAGLGVYTDDFEKLQVERADERPLMRTIEKPENLETMKEIACRIAADFPHARIDLYNCNGRIIFGEITFFDGSGYMTFDPDEFDFELGERFILPQKRDC